MAWSLFHIHVIATFVNPFTADAIVEPPRMDSRRFAEVSAHTSPEVIDNNEGTTFKQTSQYQQPTEKV